MTLRQMAKERGMTATRLAKEAFITLNYLWQIDTGRRLPRRHVVRRLARALGVEPDVVWEVIRNAGATSKQ